MNNLRLFALGASHKFGLEVASHLDIELSLHQEERFSDGEQYLRALCNVRGKDVFVIQSLYTGADESITEKFTRLLFFIGSLRDASAASVTAVIPYLGFFRQDRKTESRAPITTKYVAQLLEAMGTKRLLTMDVHSLTALHNAFNMCRTDNLEAVHLLVKAVCDRIHQEEMAGRETLREPRFFTVVAPDEGGIRRALQARKLIQELLGRDVGFAFVDKRHESGTATDRTSSSGIVGDVANLLAIIWDDMISSGGTIRGTRNRIIEANGIPWGVAVVHPLCVDKVNDNLLGAGHIFTMDTIDSGRLSSDTLQRTTILSASRLFAQAIRRIYDGESISDLLSKGVV